MGDDDAHPDGRADERFDRLFWDRSVPSLLEDTRRRLFLGRGTNRGGFDGEREGRECPGTVAETGFEALVPLTPLPEQPRLLHLPALMRIQRREDRVNVPIR
jgi:hypothetical protein